MQGIKVQRKGRPAGSQLRLAAQLAVLSTTGDEKSLSCVTTSTSSHGLPVLLLLLPAVPCRCFRSLAHQQLCVGAAV